MTIIVRLVLSQEIFVHFLQRRGVNSLILAFSTLRTVRRRPLSSNGDERVTANSVRSVVAAMQSTALGVPLFLAKDDRTNKSQLKRTWTKSLVWWTCRRLAKSEKSSRCTVSLTKETSSVDEVFASRRTTSKPNCCF